MLPGFRPPRECASVEAADLAVGSVRDFLLNPDASIKDIDLKSPRPKPGKYHIAPGQKAKIGRGLLELGLTAALEADELVWFRDGPLVNGGFAVGKNKLTELGTEVQRWIQSLVASISLQEVFPGDIQTLPYCGQWRNLVRRFSGRH